MQMHCLASVRVALLGAIVKVLRNGKHAHWWRGHCDLAPIIPLSPQPYSLKSLTQSLGRKSLVHVVSL